MRRVRARMFAIVTLLAFALPLVGGACARGISDPAAYQEAAGSLENAIGAVERTTLNARGGSDPPEFGRNLATLLPPLRTLQAQVAALDVKDPALLVLHQGLGAAVDAHLEALESLHATITSTPLKDTKETFGALQQRFEAAVAEWRLAVATL